MDFYQQNIQEAGRVLSRLKRQINRLALSRLGVILLGGVGLFRVVQTESIWGVVLVFLGIVFVFAGLVYRQSLLERERTRWDAFFRINQNEIDIRDGKPNMYDHGVTYSDPSHPYSDDLDIYGAGSLYAFINRCATQQGRDLLAAWLSAPAGKELIEARQDAIRELAGDPHWCQQFQIDLFAGIEDQRNLKELLTQYIGSGQLRFGNKWLRGYVRIAPFLVVGSFVVAYWSPVGLFVGIWLLIAHLLAVMGAGGKVSRIIGRVDKAGLLLNKFSDAIAHIEERDWTGTHTRELAVPFSSSDKKISTVFKALADLLERLDYRLNMLVGTILNMVLLWDFKQVFALQDWQQAHGGEVLQALDVVAEFEVLTSLSILSINHPDWAVPRILGEAAVPCLRFRSMAHPLIPKKKVVSNDYSNDDHRIALVTGSNMAGKSTFLRTVGINMVLALCGAPACARSLEVSVMHLVSYMRIKDSLQESTSTFKAELDRMNMVLDTVRNQPLSFFLIDEMLRGTNSVDKYRGSKAIIERLIADGTSGMVATHDLQLAELEDTHPGIVRNYHFDIQVREGEMLFDYKLKNGACTVFNASILLKGIGIDVDPTPIVS